MPKPLKKKLFRAQFLITKPPKSKYEKVKGVSNILFILAKKEIDVKIYIENKILEDIRKQNNNDETIYLKTLNIKEQKMDGLISLS